MLPEVDFATSNAYSAFDELQTNNGEFNADHALSAFWSGRPAAAATAAAAIDTGTAFGFGFDSAAATFLSKPTAAAAEEEEEAELAVRISAGEPP